MYQYGKLGVTTVFSGTEWTWVLAYDTEFPIPLPCVRVVYADATRGLEIGTGGTGSQVTISSSENTFAVAYTHDGKVYREDCNFVGHIRVQIFHPNGDTIADAGIVSNQTNLQNAASIAGLVDGKYAVVWQDYYQSNCYGNVFYPNGSRHYAEDLHISDNVTEYQNLK